MDDLNATYSVAYDEDVTRSLNGNLMKSEWWSWLVYGVKCGFGYVVLAAFAWVLFSFHVQQYNVAALWQMTALFFITGLMIPVLTYVRTVDRRERDGAEGMNWTCTMTEEGWSFQQADGLLTFIPWSLMTLTQEQPDAWLVNYGEGLDTWVYRRALRENGLEDEFFRRIGGGKVADSVSSA